MPHSRGSIVSQSCRSLAIPLIVDSEIINFTLQGTKRLYICGAVEDCVCGASGYSLEIQMGSALTQNVSQDLAQLDCFSLQEPSIVETSGNLSKAPC